MITEFEHNVAEVVSGSPLTTESQVQSQACACEICSDQEAVGQVSHSNVSCAPVSIIPPLLHTHSLSITDANCS